MTTTTTFGWGNDYLAATPAGRVNLDSAGQLAVQQTLARYVFALDQGDLEALGDVLAEHATMTAAIAGGATLGPFDGRAAILDMVRDATGTQTDQRRHNLANLTFRSADTDKATVWAYLTLTSNGGGRSTIVTTGFYTFRLQRTRSQWQIVELLVGMDNGE